MEKSKQLIDIESQEKAVLLEFYKKIKREILEKLKEVESKIADIEGVKLVNVTTDTAQTKLPLSGGSYDRTWFLPQKMIFALTEIGRFATLREMFEKIAEYEPELKVTKEVENKFFTQMASTITHKTKVERDFGRFRKNENEDYKIGLISWFHQAGIPKYEYMNKA